nr:immunoglobulin heavy chain junction region [Macaca mulatta]
CAVDHYGIGLDVW